MNHVELLDTLYTVETPEGVDLELRVAGPISRALSWLIDQSIRATGYLLLGGMLGLLGESGQGLMLIALFLMEWFYPVVFEVLWRGQTPGKRAMGLAVVHDDGRPVGWGPSLIRNLLRFADFLPMAYATGLVAMVTSRNFKRLGDLAAETVVIYIDRPPAQPALPAAPPQPPPAPLTLAEQRAIIAFALRSAMWSAERRAELVGLLAPTFPDEASVMGTARWLVGRR